MRLRRTTDVQKPASDRRRLKTQQKNRRPFVIKTSVSETRRGHALDLVGRLGRNCHGDSSLRHQQRNDYSTERDVSVGRYRGSNIVERKGCAVTDINATIRRLRAAAKGKMYEAFRELGKKRRSWEKNCAIVSHLPAEDDNVTAFKPFRVAGEGRTLK